MTYLRHTCTGCGRCIEVCPFGAVEKTEEEEGRKEGFKHYALEACG